MVLVEHEQEGLPSRSAYVPDDTLPGEDVLHCHIFRRPEFECKRRMGCFGGLVRDPLRGVGELGTDNELPAAVRVVEERTVDEEEILDTLQDEPVPHRRHRVPRDDELMYARFSKPFETMWRMELTLVSSSRTFWNLSARFCTKSPAAWKGDMTTLRRTNKSWRDSVSSPRRLHSCCVNDHAHPGGDMLPYAPLEIDRKSTRLNSSHSGESRMPSSA